MELNDITVEQLDNAASTIETFQSDNSPRDFQQLNDILPLALELIKAKRRDMEHQKSDTKFYAPIWVSRLLNRLSDGELPLPDEEFTIFYDMVRNLSVSDFKSSVPNLFGYEVQYISYPEISDMVLALKRYFKLV